MKIAVLRVIIALYGSCLSFQIYLNNLANYIPSAWNNATGCTVCESRALPSDRSQWPMVVMALFIERPTPFLSEVLGSVTALDYPKQRMRLWVHNAVCERRADEWHIPYTTVCVCVCVCVCCARGAI